MINYDNFLSDRVKSIKPSGIRRFFDLAAGMKDCISLGIGEPDFVTPDEVRQAAVDSINRGCTQYTSNAGEEELRELIGIYLKRFKLDYDYKKEILVTVGSSEAMDLSMRAILNDGDEVLVPEPSYVSYAPLVKLAGGKPVAVVVKESDEFKLTAEEVERAITKKTKVILIPYPCNPTGAVMEKEFLAKLVPLILKHNLFVITDEVYCELNYGDEHTSIASFPKMRERTIVTNGFSKAFAMTGWRIGYLAAPEEIVEQCYKIHQYGIMCAPTAGQHAAKAALKTSLKNDFLRVREMKADYNKRRVYLHKAFNGLGLSCFEPKGAFYCFPNVSSTGLSAAEFCERLLVEKKVAVVPGTAFGESCFNNFRACYAVSMKKLEQAVGLIGDFLKEIKK
jgi:aminotransferase